MTQFESSTAHQPQQRTVRAAILLGHAGADTVSYGITGVERVVQLLLEGFASTPIAPFTVYPGSGRLGAWFHEHSQAVLERQPQRRWDPGFNDALSGFLQQHDIDVVLSIGMRHDFHAALACRRLGLPHVIHRPVALADETMAWWRRLGYGVFDTWALHRCREVIACSQASAARMRQTQGLPASRIVVVPNGVEFPQVSEEERRAARDSTGIAEDTLLVVGVGQLIRRKSFHVLIEAVARAAQQTDQRFAVLLLGEGPERTRLQETARRTGVTLRLPGFVEAPAHLVAAADMSVLPSLAEGMPLVVLEAMALGIPTIATNVAGTPEVIEDGTSGVLVPPNDVPALAQALLDLARDPARRRRLGQAGRERTHARFSLAAMVDGFVASLQRNARGG